MNIYKKTIVSFIALTVGTICISDLLSPAHSNAGGAPIGKTGSPGDGSNCTGCHSGTAATSPGLITSNVPLTGYIPGDTYTITATITVAGINKFGFEISPQGATASQKGTLVVTNITETKLIGTTAKYITHKSTGTAGTGSKTWTFNWIAPAAGSGNAILYGAFLAANGNGANSGDQVFLSSLLIQENLSAGISEMVNNFDHWIIYPNPCKENLTIRSLVSENENYTLEIMDITGKRMKTIANETFSQTQSIDIADLPSGIYVLIINSEKGRATKKFIKK
jgi:hypothetical protein